MYYPVSVLEMSDDWTKRLGFFSYFYYRYIQVYCLIDHNVFYVNKVFNPDLLALNAFSLCF
jgi:hypothetical protein